MRVFSADLHNHTPASADHLWPETSAREIVEAALEAGLDIYAATDHISCAFVGALLAAADQVAEETGRRLLVVPGTELRVTSGSDEAHITALFDPKRYEKLFPALMHALGITVPCAAHAEAPFLTVERDPVGVARTIQALGGLACVSHVDRLFGDYRLIDTPLFDRLASERAVSAIDVLDPASARDRLAVFDVSVIGCSDSHSCDRIGARRTLLEMEDLTFASLRRALKRGAVVPEALV